MAPDLAPLLAPRAIAVVGASRDPAKVGGMPIRLLRENGYAGAIHPVHRSERAIQGLPATPTVEAIGTPVDLAVVAVPAADVAAAVDDLARARTRAAVVFSSGFAETGAEGAARQHALAARARDAGLLLLGPNCLGAMNLHARVFATFSPVALGGGPPPGRVALVSQSGAFGGYAFALAREAGLGLRHWITTGNEAGLDVADAIRWLADDAGTDAVLAYLEGARDLGRLDAALAAARAARKPVVVVKVGRTGAGRRAARLHTGSDTGDDAAYDALFAARGAVRARTVTELFRIGQVLAGGRRPLASAAGALGIVSVSGGVGIAMADRAEELGLALPPLPADAAARLVARIPFAATANPIDVTGQAFAQPGALVEALEDAARCGAYGQVAVFLAGAPRVPGLWPVLQQTVEQLAADADAAPLVWSGVFDADQRAWLEARGSRTFVEPTDAVEAAARLRAAA